MSIKNKKNNNNNNNNTEEEFINKISEKIILKFKKNSKICEKCNDKTINIFNIVKNFYLKFLF